MAAELTNRTAPPVVGIDLGGTKILAAVVDAEGRILARAKARTQPERPTAEVITTIADAVTSAVAQAGLRIDEIGAVGIAAPGVLDAEAGVVRFAPNLRWHDVPLSATLRKHLGVPVYLENDVNMGTLAEHTLGSGRGARDVVGIFVGTGIGGGIILNGRLHRGRNGSAGEIGHMVVQMGGPRCGCGRRGCLEAVASRTAIVRDLKTAIAAGVESVLPKLVKGDLERITSGALAEAVAQHDELTISVLKDATRSLGIGVAGIVNFLGPEMIVLGGGVIEALDDSWLERVRQAAHKYAIGNAMEGVEIVRAQLGDDAVFLGAAVLARQMLAEAPPLRLAVIDIGTNSVELLAAAMRHGHIVQMLRDEERITLLGEGFDQTGVLSAAAMDRTLAAISEFALESTRSGIDRLVALATSAVRSAENGAEFVERVRQDAGIEVRTLTGDQEAELTFQGVIADEMLADRRLLAVDVGGGAMELVLGSSEGIEARLSLDLGGARLAQRFLTSDPVAPQEMEQLRSFVREVLSAVISTASTQGRLVVATGGTARALAAMDLLETGGSADAVHGYVLSAPRVNVLLDQLARMPRAERRRVPGLPSARADIIVAGTAIFATLMDTLGIDRMVISARGLRYGALALLAREK
jgi:glucokinase